MNDERELYEHMWTLPWYRECSPGEGYAHQVKITTGVSVLCVGCGTGREGLVLSERGADVTLQDLVGNSRDPEAMHLPFVLGDAAEITGRWDLIFSSDMLEHLPPDRVEPVLRNLATLAPRAYLVAHCRKDSSGPRAGVGDLHKTVREPQWWLDQARKHWRTVEALTGRASKVVMECLA